MYSRCVLVSITLALAPPLAAQGWIEAPREARVPQSVTRVASTVRANVDGPVVTFEIEERYRNDGRGLAEGSYLFPLPGEAVFTDFSLFQGRQELRGEIMNAQQARAIYEEIVRRKKDPALLTLAGHGIIRAQVFPIQPGETRTVILRFTQRLERTGDALLLRYSLGRRGGSAATIHFTVTLPDAQRFGRPYSPTHGITLDRQGTRTDIVFKRIANGGDVHLLLPLRERAIGASILTHAPASREDGFFMLLVTPTSTDATAIPRDVTFVVDVSGSMAGEKIDQAKAALRQALDGLRPADHFRLIAFSSTVRSFLEEPHSADRATIRAAKAFVDGLSAQGGTNIQGALERALEGPKTRDRLGIVLFLTDGVPSVGEKSPELLGAFAAAHAGELRVFPLGVGHDVNTYLLDRLARDARGAVDYVAPGESVEFAVGRLFTRVSRPALTDLRIIEAPATLRELAPAVLPDVFYGDEFVLTGRYRGAAAAGRLVLEGTRHGKRERIVVAASFPRHNDANGFLTTLWASRRIGELTQSMRLEGSSPEVIAQIRELGLRYGVLTEYTSYLVLEPEMVAQDRPAPATLRPEEQAGRESFERANESRQLRSARTAADADFRLDEVIVTGKARGAVGGQPQSRRAGNRMFAFRDGAWTDIGFQDSLRTVSVVEFSPAYFAIVQAMPELAETMASGGPVALAGRRVNLRIGPTGQTAWRTGELDRFMQDFRGT